MGVVSCKHIGSGTIVKNLSQDVCWHNAQESGNMVHGMRSGDHHPSLIIIYTSLIIVYYHHEGRLIINHPAITNR